MGTSAKNTTVAVVGAGPVGLAALKCLREEGFAVTAFESRDDVGGVWYYSQDEGTTTCLKDTLLNSSKFVAHFSDYPFPPDYPTYPPAPLMHEYFKGYVKDFGLRENIHFDTTVDDISRVSKTGKWRLTLRSNGATKNIEFDKVVLSNGLVYRPVIPKFEGSERFEGALMHARDYKSAQSLLGKNVVVVGIGNTAADVAVDLAGTASKVYLSHRRGALVISRFRLGAPVELSINYNTLRLLNFMEEKLPTFTGKIIDWLTEGMMDKCWETDPSWGLKPSPSFSTTLPCVNESLIPLLAEGAITSVRGLRRFIGPRSVELDDGTVVDDVDAVILGTGYSSDTTITPWLEKATPRNYGGPPMPRLFLQIFPPEYADSIAFLNTYNATDCAWVLGELCSMAIAQLWAGKSSFPSRERMETSIRRQMAFNASMWRRDHSVEKGVVRAGEFYQFIHAAAGTGLRKALGWGISGWRFSLGDREMAKLMNWGIVTPHMMRLIKTGKRKAWDGAREAIKKTNSEARNLDSVPQRFCLSELVASYE